MNDLLSFKFKETFTADLNLVTNEVKESLGFTSRNSSPNVTDKKISAVAAASFRIVMTIFMGSCLLKAITSLHLTSSVIGIGKVALHILGFIVAREWFVISRTTENLVNKGIISTVTTTARAVWNSFWNKNVKESTKISINTALTYMKLKTRNYDQITSDELQGFTSVIVSETYFRNLWQEATATFIQQIAKWSDKPIQA